MSEPLSTVGAITMFIENTQRSKVFYEQVFGAKAVYEDANAVAFNFENMVVNLLRVPAAHELIAPAPVGDAGAARRFQLTIWIDAFPPRISSVLRRTRRSPFLLEGSPALCRARPTRAERD